MDGQSVGMESRPRVFILCTQGLLGEGIQHILSDEPAVSIVGVELLAAESLHIVNTLDPDVVIIAEEAPSPQGSWLTGQLVQMHPAIPLICVDLQEDSVRVHRSHQVPASTADLKEALRKLAQISDFGMQPPMGHDEGRIIGEGGVSP